MRLHDLVSTSADVARTRKRLEKVRLLAERIEALETQDRATGVAYLMGELPQGRIGLGPAVLRELTDIAPQAEPQLDLQAVSLAFDAVRDARGSGSKGRKIDVLRELLSRATAEEQVFLHKLILGELRHGALEGLLLEAVAQAADLPSAPVRRAAMLGGSLVEVAVVALTEGEPGLGRFRLTCGQPILPMLAQPGRDAAEVLEHMGRAGLEWKLDGARIQVHKQGADVRVFTRRLHDVTAAVPEIVDVVRSYAARELILDGEALVLDEGGRPRSFQTTMRRFGRKLDVARMRDELPLSPSFFDLLLVDGNELLDRPHAERAGRLRELLPETDTVPRFVAEREEQIEEFYAQALQHGHEGIVAKDLDAPYEAGRRGRRWMKLKPAHTLDLVVLAAEWGSGRRTGTLSNLHLGARATDGSDGFVMLGKTFKGLTDEMLAFQTRELLALEVQRDGHIVHVRPKLVVEIAFDGVQTSPHYPGGVALRFARVKAYRMDKSPAQADTLDAVLALLPA